MLFFFIHSFLDFLIGANLNLEPILTQWSISIPEGFLTVSGGIEMAHRAKMVEI